ncbi:MAG: hypothetical protein ABMB14_08130, partial [Myxococcota bacterium]
PDTRCILTGWRFPPPERAGADLAVFAGGNVIRVEDGVDLLDEGGVNTIETCTGAAFDDATGPADGC